MRAKNLLDSFNFAVQGIYYAFNSQRNMKVHFLIGLLVIVLAAILNISRIEIMILLLVIGLVISAEMVNTAIEEVVNLVTKKYHPLAKTAKNVAAGAVLVSSVISVCIGYLIFIERLILLHPAIIRQSYGRPALTLVALLVVLFLTVAAKAWAGRTNYFRGGMPSGHTAIAFSLATVIFFVAEGYVVILGFFLALLVAQSRVEGKIHNFAEIIVGAVLGILVTLFFFQLKG